MERERELAALATALDEAAAGRGGVVAVVGEPGIGKSRLLAAAREHGRDAGMLVCSARGAELERAFPFGVVRQLAASSYADTTREERASWFAGVARMAAPLFREEAIAEEAAPASYPRLHALYWLCANAARLRPLVLLVDDAHWADDASLAFAGFLARRVGELPLALLVATRPPGQDGAAELVRVLADPDTVTLAPGPLSPQGVSALLRGILGSEPDPAFAEACLVATEGNPFLLGELAGEVRAQGIEAIAAQAERVGTLRPAGVRTTALLRLAQLDDPARRLARTLALLGDHTALPVAAELAGLDEPASLDAALALEQAGLVARDGGLGFVHPLLRAAITDDVPSLERLHGHAAAARVLARHGAEPDAVAVHLLRAEPAGDPWVVETLRAGARCALELGDPKTAVAYLRRAVEEPVAEPDRAAVLLELGLAEAKTDARGAIARIEAALAAASDAGTRIEAALRLAQLLNLTGNAAEAARVLEAGIASADGAASEPLRAELLATAYVRISSRRRLAPLIAALREPEGPPATPLEVLTTAALAVEHAVTRGEPARGAELARRALAAGLPAGPIPVLLALVAAGRFDEAEAAATTALDAARGRGSVLDIAVASEARAAVRLARDDLQGAEADATACLELLEDVDAVAMGAAATAVRAGIELGRAPGDLEQLVAVHRGDPDHPSAASLLLADGMLRALEGDFDAAVERFERCGEYEWAARCPALYPWRSAAASALARLGRTGETAARAREELELAATPRALGVALQAAALTADDSEPLLAEAVGALEHADAPVELARALVTRGALLRRRGQRTVARADLQQARELAVSRGAARLADAAAAELRSSGVRLRRTPARGADALTPGERRVVELAVTGLSNRDIAQSLFVSEKTVEAHLGRAYKKLGIRSRGRLAAALGG